MKTSTRSQSLQARLDELEDQHVNLAATVTRLASKLEASIDQQRVATEAVRELVEAINAPGEGLLWRMEQHDSSRRFWRKIWTAMAVTAAGGLVYALAKIYVAAAEHGAMPFLGGS